MTARVAAGEQAERLREALARSWDLPGWVDHRKKGGHRVTTPAVGRLARENRKEGPA